MGATLLVSGILHLMANEEPPPHHYFNWKRNLLSNLSSQISFRFLVCNNHFFGFTVAQVCCAPNINTSLDKVSALARVTSNNIHLTFTAEEIIWLLVQHAQNTKRKVTGCIKSLAFLSNQLELVPDRPTIISELCSQFYGILFEQFV